MNLILRHLSGPSRQILLMALVGAVVVFMLDLRVRAQLVRGSFPDAADKYYLPPPETLQVASLGYREAAADLIWVATIQHATDRKSYGASKPFPWLERYLDSVLALNPYQRKVYVWADGTLTYGRGRLTNDNWFRAIEYLERGHRVFPRDWELLFKLASAYTELRTDDPQKRRRWMRRAADYLWKAHLVGGGPPWLGSVAARYWSEEGQWLLAYRRTLEELKATERPRVKEEMKLRLGELLNRSAGGRSMVAAFGRLALPVVANPAAQGLYLVGEALQRRWVRSASRSRVEAVAEQKDAFDRRHRQCLPYGSSDLFMLLGPCPTPAADPGLTPQRTREDWGLGARRPITRPAPRSPRPRDRAHPRRRPPARPVDAAHPGHAGDRARSTPSARPARPPRPGVPGERTSPREAASPSPDERP